MRPLHGWRLSVVTGVPLLPAAERACRARGLLARERHHGVDIYRAAGTRLSKRRFVGRATNYVTCFLSAC